MTIIVAVRTGSAAILAADSKLSTQSVAGRNPDGSPRWLPQSYDHAIKIAHDTTRTAIAAFAGNGNIGGLNAADYFSRIEAHLHVDATRQDARVREISEEMTSARAAYAAGVSMKVDQLPETVVLLAAPPFAAVAPRFWHIRLRSDKPEIMEILQQPGVFFEGNGDITMALMYGALPTFLEALRTAPGISQQAFDAARMTSMHLCPITQVNFWTMPVQDAMDFAFFCATAQVEMDRFRSGLAPTGGPIDLLVLEMAPQPKIRGFPGKTLHHPSSPASAPFG